MMDIQFRGKNSDLFIAKKKFKFLYVFLIINGGLAVWGKVEMEHWDKMG